MATLTAEERKALPDSAFALPGRRYPIHDLAHARDALARVAADGTPDDQETVRAAVHKRYPELAKEGDGKKIAASADRPILGTGDLRLDSTSWSAALTLGQGLPVERNGKPCAYWDKEAIGPGTIHDAAGNVWHLTPKDIDDIVEDVSRAMSFGHEPALPDRHFGTPGRNFGFVKRIKKNSRGFIELTHQHVGEKENNDALNLKTSVLLRPNYTDERGRKWRWWLEHNAVIPSPQIRDLADYKPTALAASNGQATEADYLILAVEPEATPPKEIPMDLTTLRASLGEPANGKSDIEVLALSAAAVTALADTRTKLRTALGAGATDKPDDQLLVLAADQFEANTALATELTSVEEQLATANQRVLALSAGDTIEPDPQVLALSAKLAEKDIEMAELKRQITPKQAIYLRERVKSGSALVLSADASGKTPVDDMIAFAALADGHIVPNKPLGSPVTPLALGAGGSAVDSSLQQTMVAMANGGTGGSIGSVAKMTRDEK